MTLLNEPRELLHPQAATKPKMFEVQASRQGGSLSARCGCGWYCNHNHKAPKQAMMCVARHFIAINNLDDKPKDYALEQWDIDLDS